MPGKGVLGEQEGSNHKGNEQVAAFFMWDVFN